MGRLGNTAAALGLSLLLAGCTSSLEREQGITNGGVNTLLRLAESTKATGNAQAAIPLYRRAHKISPEDVRPLRELGVTFNELGAYGQAAETWKQALALSPSDPDLHRGYGFTLTGLHQPHLALARFRKALAHGPDAAAYNGMGVAQDMLGEPDDAQASYEAALAMDPDSLAIANNFGLSLALSGRYERAIELLEDVVKSPDATAQHRQNLALAFGLAGRVEDAARVGRMDLNEAAVRSNLAYYATLRAIDSHATRVSSVGTGVARAMAR